MLFPTEIQDFEFQCVKAGSMDIETSKLSKFDYKYYILCFYPLDFTFVCPTEIIQISKMADKFRENNSEIFFISGDSVYSHLAWKNVKQEEGGIGNVPFTMISDLTHKLSSQFNLFNENTGTTVRSTVILDQSLNVLHISANIDPIGRSSNELLRLVKAIDFQSKNSGICPVDFETN